MTIQPFENGAALGDIRANLNKIIAAVRFNSAGLAGVGSNTLAADYGISGVISNDGSNFVITLPAAVADARVVLMPVVTTETADVNVVASGDDLINAQDDFVDWALYSVVLADGSTTICLPLIFECPADGLWMTNGALD